MLLSSFISFLFIVTNAKTKRTMCKTTFFHPLERQSESGCNVGLYTNMKVSGRYMRTMVCK